MITTKNERHPADLAVSGRICMPLRPMTALDRGIWANFKKEAL